jgi:hypothetical protein
VPAYCHKSFWQNADYEINRIEVMVDESNRFLNKYQMNDLTRGNPKVLLARAWAALTAASLLPF